MLKLSRAAPHGVWLSGIASIVFILSISSAIVGGTWLYLVIAILPFALYLMIEKPFIFPFGFYVALIPIEGALAVTGTSEGATVTKYLGVLTILVLGLKGVFEKKLRMPDKAAIFWPMFLVFSSLSTLWAIRIHEDVLRSTLGTSAGLVILYLIAISYRIQRKEYDTLKIFLMVGGAVASLFIFKAFSEGMSLTGSAMRATAGLSIGANKQAFDLLIPFSVCMASFLRTREGYRMVSLALSCIILVGIMLTGSRGAVLGACAIVMSYIFFLRKRTAVGVFIVVMFAVMYSVVPDMFYERVGNAVESGGSGRLDIWSVGLRALKEYWLTGAGYLNFGHAHDEFARPTDRNFGYEYTHPLAVISVGSHNIYLQVFVELGIVGITLLIVAIASHYRRLKNWQGQDRLDVAMLKGAFWGILVASLFLDTLRFKSFWLLWVLILIHSRVREAGNESNRSLPYVSENL